MAETLFFLIDLILISHKNTKLGNSKPSLRMELGNTESRAPARTQDQSTHFSVVCPQVRWPGRLPSSCLSSRPEVLGFVSDRSSFPSSRIVGTEEKSFSSMLPIKPQLMLVVIFLMRPGILDRCGKYKGPEDKVLKS